MSLTGDSLNSSPQAVRIKPCKDQRFMTGLILHFPFVNEISFLYSSLSYFHYLMVVHSFFFHSLVFSSFNKLIFAEFWPQGFFIHYLGFISSVNNLFFDSSFMPGGDSLSISESMSSRINSLIKHLVTPFIRSRSWMMSSIPLAR